MDSASLVCTPVDSTAVVTVNAEVRLDHVDQEKSFMDSIYAHQKHSAHPPQMDPLSVLLELISWASLIKAWVALTPLSLVKLASMLLMIAPAILCYLTNNLKIPFGLLAVMQLQM